MNSIVQPVALATALASAPAPAAPEMRAAAPLPQESAPEASRQSLSFEIDRESGRPIVRIVDEVSGEVVRQLPTEEALAISRELGRLQGLLIRAKA